LEYDNGICSWAFEYSIESEKIRAKNIFMILN